MFYLVYNTNVTIQENISNAEHIYQNDNVYFSGKMIKFGFVVNNKIIFKVAASEDSGLGSLYLSNPKIINIDHLKYLPNLGDVWNGKSFEKGNIEHFLNEEEIEHPFDPYPELLTPFAFLVDNKVAYIIRVSPGSKMEQIFNQNPKIVNISEENNLIDESVL
jgi:hypothetical protein